jgi:hypothetical protein
MEEQQIVYEIVSLAVDARLKDTRAPLHRTRTGEIRPTLSICFAPQAQFVMAYSLNTEPLNQETLAALLYAAFATTEKVPYGGLPDVVTCGSMEAFTPALQHTLDCLGIRVQQGSSVSPVFRGRAERLLARMQQEFWNELSDGSPPDNLPSDISTVDLTLFEVNYLLRSYLLAYNQAISERPGMAWQPSRKGEPTQIGTLLGTLHTRTLTRKGISYLMHTYWHEQLAAFVPGTTVLLRPIPSFSASTPETIDVFIQSEWICSFVVQQEQLSRDLFQRKFDVQSAYKQQKEG